MDASHPPEDTQLDLHGIKRVSNRSRIGGHSYVYEGFTSSDTMPSFKVAIKVFKMSSLTERDEILADALRELSPSWTSIRHPHIARFYGLSDDLGECDIPAMVYNYYDNGNIITYLATKYGTDPPSLTHGPRNAEAVRLMTEVADALKYLHHINVIHTNLRGCNILIDIEHHARVSDVGMILAYATDDTKYTDSVGPAGLCRWTSPELLESLTMTKSKRLPRLSAFLFSPATDVYAYGMTLVEVISGRPPFTPAPRPGLSRMIDVDASAIHAVLKGVRPSIPSYLNNNPVLRELVTRCWDTEPAKRPSMPEVCDILATLPHPSNSDPPSPSRVTTDWPILKLLKRILTWPISRIYSILLSVLRFLKFTNRSR